MLILVLAACQYLDPEKVGAYDCDAYCEQVLDKTEECAAEAAGSSDVTDEEIAAYVAEARADWESSSKAEMIASCEDDVASSGKTDTECQAETATLNNLTCEEILDVLTTLADAAG